MSCDVETANRCMYANIPVPFDDSLWIGTRIRLEHPFSRPTAGRSGSFRIVARGDYAPDGKHLHS